VGKGWCIGLKAVICFHIEHSTRLFWQPAHYVRSRALHNVQYWIWFEKTVLWNRSDSMCQGICVHFKLQKRKAVKGHCACIADCYRTELDAARSWRLFLFWLKSQGNVCWHLLVTYRPTKMILTGTVPLIQQFHLHCCDHHCVLHITLRFYFGSTDSILGPGFESRLRAKTFSRLRIFERFWGPPTFLFSGYRGSLQWIKWPEREINH